MKYGKLRIEPIEDDPEILAKVSVEVPLGDGMHLQCLNAFLVRKRRDPSQLIVLYPKSRATNGRAVVTWTLFGEDQRKFDASVIAEYQRLVRSNEWKESSSAA